MNMKLSRQSLEKTKKTREVTEVKGQREQRVETDHEEIVIMTEIGKAKKAPNGMSFGEIESTHASICGTHSIIKKLSSEVADVLSLLVSFGGLLAAFSVLFLFFVTIYLANKMMMMMMKRGGGGEFS